MDTSLYNHIEKLSQLIKPKPAESWIYLDEHPDSIQDPGFFAPNSATHWVDLPASYHDGAGVLAFVRGHVELKKWASVYTIQPVNKSTYGGTSTKVGDIDISWFRARTSRKSDIY